MRACVTLRTAENQPEAERLVFEFVARLEEVCDSIASCSVFAEGPLPVDGDLKAWSALVSLEVFGEEIRVLGSASMSDGAEALRLALEDALKQAAHKLEKVALEHTMCACGHALTRCA